MSTQSKSDSSLAGRHAGNAFGAREIPDYAIEEFRKYPVLIQENGCWHWNGGFGPKGYGFVNIPTGSRRKESYLAHRVAYTAFYGPIPDGCLVCHACDNQRCVNPKHLFPGTNHENMLDRKNKKMTPAGENHPHAILNNEKVREIVALLPTMNNVQIGKMFGISPTNISSIRTGKNWTHVTGFEKKRMPYKSVAKK